MRDIFANVDTDAVLLIDAENTFNSINRKVILYDLKFICTIIATYIINCYATLSMLFIVVGEGYFLLEFVNLTKLMLRKQLLLAL